MQKDNRLGVLQRRGGYLYDKGENDELFYVIGISTTDLQVYFIMHLRKSKENNKKFFYFLKSISITQKMLKINIFTNFHTIFVNYRKKMSKPTCNPTPNPATRSEG